MTARELRHSFVSVLSDAGLPVEEIAQLIGHRGTTVTELVYSHQLRRSGPMIPQQPRPGAPSTSSAQDAMKSAVSFSGGAIRSPRRRP